MTTTKTTAYTFAPDAITCKGKTFPVEYALQPSGTVTAFVQLDDRRVRVRFDEGAAEYHAAPAAPAAPTSAADTTAPALPLLLPTLDPVVYTPDSFAALIAA